MEPLKNTIFRFNCWALVIVLLAFADAKSALATSPISSQDFGQVPVQGTGSTQTVALSFSGLSAVPTLSLSYRGEFSLGSPNCTTSACTVQVTFSPQYPGLRESALIATDAAQRTVGTVLVHGLGLAPQTSMHPGIITTVAGNGSLNYSGDGGAATLAGFWSPQGIAVDSLGNLFIADTLHQVVRKVTAGGTITTVSGSSNVFDSPTGLALDAAGNIYVADYGNNVVREINGLTGAVTVFAGGGHPASGLGDGGPATSAKLSGPSDVAVDASGNVFIADTNNGLIRRVDTSGNISTVAGGGTSTVAPWGDGASALTATLSSPQGVALDSGGNVLYIADTGHHVIRYVVLSGGVISTLAGNGSPGYLGDSGPAIQATLHTPVGLTVDAAGDVYIADSGNNVVREVLAGSGVITTVAGNGLAGFAGDGGTPPSAELFTPRNVALDASGNLFVADNANNVIRKATFALLGLDFGSVNVGLASAAQGQTIFNIGNRPLDFSALSITGNFRQDTSSAWDCSSSSVVLAGTGCVISLQFVPAAANTSIGNIRFTTNSLNAAGSGQAGLTGTGAAGAVPQLQISPASLSFPAQSVGTSSATQTIVFKNTGTADLNILDLWLTGQDAGAFQITGSICGTVKAGQSCSMSVVFAPLYTGSQSATITFTDNLANSTQTIPLSGTAIPPQIIPENTSVQIGEPAAGLFLAMQSDGNLVLYQNGAALWASGTPGQNCGTNRCFAAFQSDGNFVVYNGSTPIWNSQTAGNSGAQLTLSGQAPYIQILGGNRSVLWANSYTFPAGALVLPQGASVNIGSAFLAMQGDGNLVLYQDGAALWNSGTSGQNCGTNRCFTAFQGDGNFVVYNGSTPIWNSQTYGNSGGQLIFSNQSPHMRIIANNQSLLWADSYTFSAGNFLLAQGASVRMGSAFLVMQGDGNLVLYQNGIPLWNSGTPGQKCGVNRCFAAFQGDGNFVVYNGNTPIWNSQTYGNSGGQLVLSNQAPHVRIIGNSQSILWADSYTFSAGSFLLAQGASVRMGSVFLVMQGDGNLVLYQNGIPLWNSNTGGRTCGVGQCLAAFQGDGNFVVYNGSTAIWNSRTGGNSGAQLVLSNQSPHLQILAGNQLILWKSPI